jgi:hypothetical protein
MDVAALYRKEYVDKQFERTHLFQLLAERYGVGRVLYPGSFCHVTPSFVYPDVTYVDTDRRARRFFADPRQVIDLIAGRKTYSQEPQITFHAADYAQGFDAPEESYDLLVSQYAGFVSLHCKRYLKVGGLLLANNSHGDAGMASIDEDYAFQAAVTHRGGRYRLIETGLDTYFQPKREVEVTRATLEQLGRGIGYKKTASAYLFRRVC